MESKVRAGSKVMCASALIWKQTTILQFLRPQGKVGMNNNGGTGTASAHATKQNGIDLRQYQAHAGRSRGTKKKKKKRKPTSIRYGSIRQSSRGQKSDRERGVRMITRKELRHANLIRRSKENGIHSKGAKTGPYGKWGHIHSLRCSNNS